MADTPFLPAPKESNLAQAITRRKGWKHLIFEQTRRRWMVYGKTQEGHGQDGIWSEIDDELIAKRVYAALTDRCKQGFSARLLNGVITLLKIRLGRTLKPPGRDYLPFRNGVLHIPTLTRKPHDPKNDFCWCLPYDYNPLATCQPILAWLKEATAGDDDTVQLLRAFLRAILTRSVKVEKFLELIGPGGTGKGTFLRLATALVGYANTHVTSLRLLEQSRFETVELIGKQLVLITDADRYTASVATLNALTGDDTIRGERKFEAPLKFSNEAMVIVAANEPVQSPDYTSGLARRRLTVEFHYRPRVVRDLIAFENGQPVGELADSLPGLLNWVLDLDEQEMLARLRGHACATMARTKADTLMATNPIAAWADACLVRADAETDTYIGVAKRLEHGQGYDKEEEWLYANYRSYMDRANFLPVSLTRFSALVVDLCQFQIGQADIQKGRNKNGAFITGIALRPQHSEAQSFIEAMLASPTPADTGRDNLVTTSTLGSVDYVDYVDSSINQHTPESPKYIQDISLNPAYPSHSTLPGKQPVTNPSHSVTTRVQPDQVLSKPHMTGDWGVYGKPLS
jgi:putative DNA primase/helicase